MFQLLACCNKSNFRNLNEKYHRDMELMTSYEEKLGKMEEDEISGEKVLTDRQIEMLQAEDERNYYSSRDENPYRQYQKVTNRLKKFKKKQVMFQKWYFSMFPMIFFR